MPSTFNKDNGKYTDFPQTGKTDRKQTSADGKQIRKTGNKQDEPRTRQKDPCRHENKQEKQKQNWFQ